MIARISTSFKCTEAELWDRLIEPGSLRFVSAPILSFQPETPGTLNGAWAVNRVYQLKLYLLGSIPLGRHQIRLVQIDRDSNTILSEESGWLAPIWNHKIWFQQESEGWLRYTDEVEIQAGWRTLPIWVFAHLFYRHRQRRWKMLLGK